MQKGTDCQDITKIIVKESIIIHFKTIEIGENIKKVIKTSIGKKIINIREGLEIIMKMSYEDRYNRDEYEYQYRDESCHMPPHFQVQSTFVNHCDTYMVIHPCMIKKDSFLKTNQ